MQSRVLRITAGDGSSLTIDKGDEPVPLHWRAVLTSPGLTATAELDNDPILFSQPMLRDYFAQLAADWRGWTGTRRWRAGALAFAAEHDGRGHIRLTVELERDLYDNWKASVPLDLDAGSLDHLARDVSSFIDGLEFGGDERAAETAHAAFED
jgi:Family of unknown function (DUF6228)